ncbi:alpha/beta hydrolase [Paenibacillus sp. WQ 127069]|uniref:Alpha/beta hydrolase n=1 Tax=Paenibacillus baimaensis TaxID=2982185 RepID=A0ABT2UHR8_9BACL|nr:alpha/beta hydrolase [Paenibacillus sp. WQ 127069]MCU6794193.1 alpha/beta hydrolase [Paenibacillus sp. WQ 127069]
MSQTIIQQQEFVLNAGLLPSGESLCIRGEVRYKHRHDSNSVLPLLPVLIISHGFKGFKDWGFFPYAASRFAEQGFYVVTFNFSCNGVNEVDFDELDKFAINTYSREQADLELILEALADHRLPDSEQTHRELIYLLGHSRGGGGSILLASRHPEVKAVVAWNGNGSVDMFDDSLKSEIEQNGVAYIGNARTGQQMPIRDEFYTDLAANRSRFDIAARLADLIIPVLLVQGSKDSDKLLAGFAAMVEAAPHHRRFIIEGGTHTFGSVHPFAGTTDQLEEAIRITLYFLREHQHVFEEQSSDTKASKCWEHNTDGGTADAVL